MTQTHVKKIPKISRTIAASNYQQSETREPRNCRNSVHFSANVLGFANASDVQLEWVDGWVGWRESREQATNAVFSATSIALRKVSNSRSDTRSLPFEASPLSSRNVHESSFIPDSSTALPSSTKVASPRDYSLTLKALFITSLSLSQLLAIHHRNHIIENVRTILLL